MVKGWSYVKKILKPSPRYRRKWIFFGLWIVSIFLDPFIFYAPSIQDEEKLYKINTVMVVLTSFVLVLNCSVFIYRIYIFHGENKKSEWLQHFSNVESNAFVVPTVILYLLVLTPIVEIRAPIFVVLGIFLVVCLVRVIGIYRLITEEVKAAEVKILLNLLLFFYGGHLFGGLWYLVAVWKTMACWKRACSNHSGCRFVDRRFNVSSGDNKFLNDICFPTEDTKTYELGIFKDALKYRIMETRTGFWKKVLYCFRWGIQNISGFGQNLQVSTYAWENILVILIAIYGVGTFSFFIGNIQNLIKSAIKKKSVKRKQQLLQWLPFEKLSKNLQKAYQQYNGQQTEGVDVENLFTNLPKDIKNNIKRELCLEMLKKAERFRRWSDASLLRLCDCVEPIVYAELTYIVREGDPIDEMLFVLRGKLWNFSTASSTNNVPPLDRRKEILKDGDFWGEELVNWVQDESSSSLSSKKLISLHLKKKKKLISHTTIKALTKVEAFVLRIDDLQKLFNEKAKILQLWFRKRKERDFYRVVLTAIKSTREQTPSGDQLTGTEIVV